METRAPPVMTQEETHMALTHPVRADAPQSGGADRGWLLKRRQRRLV